MGFFSNGWFFSNAGNTLDMKLALLQTFFCSSVPFLEFLIFSNGDLRNSNITGVGTVVGADKEGEPVFFTMDLLFQNQTNPTTSNLTKMGKRSRRRN